MINVQPEVIEFIKRQAVDFYFEPEPYCGDYGNSLMAENSLCRDYPDQES